MESEYKRKEALWSNRHPDWVLLKLSRPAVLTAYRASIWAAIRVNINHTKNMYKMTEIKTSSEKKGQIYEQKDQYQKYRWSEKIENTFRNKGRCKNKEENRNKDKHRNKDKCRNKDECRNKNKCRIMTSIEIKINIETKTSVEIKTNIEIKTNVDKHSVEIKTNIENRRQT